MVNAKVLERMSEKWQQIFLTVGIVIAVFGMRLIFPLLVVGITAHLSPAEAVHAGLREGPTCTTRAATRTCCTRRIRRSPRSAACSCCCCSWTGLFEEREITWLTWLERPLARIGKLDQLSVIIAGIVLYLFAEIVADKPATIFAAGVLGIISYLAVNGLGGLFENYEESQEEAFEQKRHGGPTQLAKAAGKAGFFLFLYLEVLDASFSFDGVIGAFAITPDPIIIALGLGLIGALFVRSLTVYLVRKGTLNDYVYLEHGAHWAIGALAIILLISISVAGQRGRHRPGRAGADRRGLPVQHRAQPAVRNALGRHRRAAGRTGPALDRACVAACVCQSGSQRRTSCTRASQYAQSCSPAPNSVRERNPGRVARLAAKPRCRRSTGPRCRSRRTAVPATSRSAGSSSAIRSSSAAEPLASPKIRPISCGPVQPARCASHDVQRLRTGSPRPRTAPAAAAPTSARRSRPSTARPRTCPRGAWTTGRSADEARQLLA